VHLRNLFRNRSFRKISGKVLLLYAVTASTFVRFVIRGVYNLCYFLSVLYKIRMECLIWRPCLCMCLPVCDLLSENQPLYGFLQNSVYHLMFTGPCMLIVE